MLDLQSKSVVLVSDVHLGFSKPGELPKLADLLNAWKDDASFHVIVPGDLLDLQRASDAAVKAEGASLWEPLKALADRGRLSFIPGNHDYRIRAQIYAGRAPEPNEVDFVSLMDLNASNTFHRYMAFTRNGQTWLVCHGDEADFGTDAKKVVGKYWQSALEVLYLALDARDPEFIMAGDDVMKHAFGEALKHAAAWILGAHLGAYGLAPGGLKSPEGGAFTLGDFAAVAPSDPQEFRKVFADGVNDYFNKRNPDVPETLQAVWQPERFGVTGLSPEDHETVAGLVATPLSPKSLAAAAPAPPSPALPAVPGLLSAYDSWDHPQDCSIAFPHTPTLIGHRHFDEAYPSWQSPRVIDCGSWEHASTRPVCYVSIDDNGVTLVRP